ncbi:MAG: M20/M25/M40 family metallo-hydrolase [Verrucomicrobia bacterium]|nr:M20/M25/M40 family metallo-hydrolase [Verrucomicrobiota bacterium]
MHPLPAPSCWPPTLAATALAASLLCAGLPATAAEVHDRLTQTFTGLIRLDTSNPPGNETRAAEYFKALLEKDGARSEIFTLAPNRGNLVARIKGNGKKKPLLLMGHTDVVGIERSKWTLDPFEAVVKDGYLYGRGALDDKSMTAVCFEVFRQIHRAKTPLDRDLIFLAESAEEGAPHEGIDFMVSRHWDQIECEYALNEGGIIQSEPEGKIRFVGVATTEKVPRQVLLSAHGTSGHGSRPRLDNAIVHLCAAVAKLGQWQPPMRMNETTRTFFQRLSSVSGPEDAFLYTNLEHPRLGPLVQERLRAENTGYNSMLRTSISPNIINGGFRFNVIPADALATLDVRWLPDENVPAFIEAMKKLIDDPAIEIVLAEPGSRKPAAPSSIETEMFQALERAQKKLFPGTATLPLMLTGATDSAQLREKGVQAYGLGTVSTEADSARVHGNDERVQLEGLARFYDFVYETVIDVAGAQH